MKEYFLYIRTDLYILEVTPKWSQYLPQEMQDGR